MDSAKTTRGLLTELQIEELRCQLEHERVVLIEAFKVKRWLSKDTEVKRISKRTLINLNNLIEGDERKYFYGDVTAEYIANGDKHGWVIVRIHAETGINGKSWNMRNPSPKKPGKSTFRSLKLMK